MQKYIVEERREITVLEDCDVLVAGAGTAGVIAAIAAARTGAATVLIEQLPAVSGTMGNGGLIANCFHSSYTPDHPDCIKVVKGIPEELYDRLIAAGGCPGYVWTDPEKCPYHRPSQVMQDREVYTEVVYKMLSEAGVKIYTHMFLSDVIMDGGKIDAIVVESKSGPQAIRAKQFIDCTGDADLAAHSGCEFLPYDKFPWGGETDFEWGGNKNNNWGGSVGFFFGMGGIDLVRYVDFAKEQDLLKEEISEHPDKDSDEEKYIRIVVDLSKSDALPEGSFLHGCKRILVQSIRGNTAQCISVIGRGGVDASDVCALTDTELSLRADVLKVAECLNRYVPGFEHAYVNWTSNQIGVRQCRSVICEYSVTWHDVKYSARFDDEIGMFGFQDFAPIGAEFLMQNKGYYGLPYRMLIPKKSENLLTAGRMNTAEYLPHMSTRNTMCCMVQGQAAGTAAALCVKHGASPRELDYKLLRERLLDDNVFIEGA